MVLLDRVMANFYMLLIAIVSLLAAVWLQFWMQSCCLQPIIPMHRITISYPTT